MTLMFDLDLALMKLCLRTNMYSSSCLRTFKW